MSPLSEGYLESIERIPSGEIVTAFLRLPHVISNGVGLFRLIVWDDRFDGIPGRWLVQQATSQMDADLARDRMGTPSPVDKPTGTPFVLQLEDLPTRRGQWYSVSPWFAGRGQIAIDAPRSRYEGLDPHFNSTALMAETARERLAYLNSSYADDLLGAGRRRGLGEELRSFAEKVYAHLYMEDDSDEE